MFDGDPDDSEDDTNEVELLLPRRETKQQAELRRSNARKRSRVALGCACNILNGTLGPGMLVLPLAFRRTGLVYGVALLVVDWALSYLALRLLLDACAHTHASGLKVRAGPSCRHSAGWLDGLGCAFTCQNCLLRKALLFSHRMVCPARGELGFPARRRLTSLVQLARAHGPKMSMFVDWSVVLYFYGTCISYLILVGGTFDHLLHYYSEAPRHWYQAPPPPAVPELGPCASSGRAWRLQAGSALRGEKALPPGAQPVPRVLEPASRSIRAASKVANATMPPRLLMDQTGHGQCGGARGLPRGET